MTGVITWAIDCGDGVCIEREQPSTAVKPMPAYGALNSSLTVNGAVHDPLTGLDTGSGNDRITTGLGEDNFTTGAGGDSFNCDDILLGHGVTGFSTENLDSRLINHDDFLLVKNGGSTESVNGTIGYEMEAGTDLKSDNRFIVFPTEWLQGLDSGGMNYAEAVGLDSSTVDAVNNVISSLQPANEFI